ncbi:TIGR03089 family protein [Arthrobacter sp. H35-D1]|uniref:TIGR03089 family protein n=1 Tax=Arthrobacter sp. H35-D1 TaxID=3046202 RepID=UPI0024B94A61|nr:TIGR03089 family protein [Arthrobacter sp. H35-D1]MDJ0312399.1 TIGR03089 family protein [Arthrobacter sp. H35-D1]
MTIHPIDGLVAGVRSVPGMERWLTMDLRPGTPAHLLTAFRTRNPTAPRLTWYGPDAERAEFSGRVLENWVAKTANYLVDELDAEPGTVIDLDLPLHWRSLVWILAAWAVGATAVVTDSGAGTGADVVTGADTGTVANTAGRADIVATTNPAAAQQRHGGASPTPLLVAVALPALQMRWMGELPARALDYCGDVRAYADEFFADDTPDPSATAWRHGATAIRYDELLAPKLETAPESASQQTASQQAPRRVLLEVRQGWAAVVPAALSAWADGGSVVLLDTAVEPTEKLRSSENINQG